MLYDPKWEVKADPFSLESLVAWMQTMDPKESYDFHCMGECLLGQWVKSIDPEARTPDHPHHTEIFTYLVNGKRVDLTEFGDIAQGDRGLEIEWTFGAALERAHFAPRS